MSMIRRRDLCVWRIPSSRSRHSTPAAPVPNHTPAEVRAMIVLCIVLIMHGSLYPWNIKVPPSFADAFADLMAQRNWLTNVGDMVGNVALFVPLGALWVWSREGAPHTRLRDWLLMFVGSIGFAFALQVMQICVPAREASLADVVWNTAGQVLGVLLAFGLRAPLRAVATRVGDAQRAPLALVALWLALEWSPFVPTIDWQHVKDALKPLLRDPQWNTRSALDVGLGLLVVTQALRPWRRRGLVLMLLVALAAVGKLFIAGQSISLPHAAGLAAGVLLAWLPWRLPAQSAGVLVFVVALLWFTIEELRPFELTNQATSFHWIPFTALLEGSLGANVIGMGHAMFWIGAMMVVAAELGARVGVLAVGLGLWVLLLEALQIFLPDRQADLTVALFPWFWVLVLGALAPARPAPQSPRRRHRRPGPIGGPLG
jgi:VanZ family protein